MGYWSTIDKNQKQTESNTSRINQLTEKINYLEKFIGDKLDLVYRTKDKVSELENAFKLEQKQIKEMSKEVVYNWEKEAIIKEVTKLEKLSNLQAKFLQTNEERIEKLQKQEKAHTKILEMDACEIQELQQENTNRELEFSGLIIEVEQLKDKTLIKEVSANQVVIDEVLSDCFQDLKVLCDSKTRTIKDNYNARFVNVNNVIDIINKYSNSQKGRV